MVVLGSDLKKNWLTYFLGNIMALANTLYFYNTANSFKSYPPLLRLLVPLLENMEKDLVKYLGILDYWTILPDKKSAIFFHMGPLYL